MTPGHHRAATDHRDSAAPKSESPSLSAGVESASRRNEFFEASIVGASVSDHPRTPGLDPQAYAENFWPTSTPVSAERHPGEDGDLTDVGEYADFGLVTLLWADQIRAANLSGDDRWHAVVGSTIPSCLGSGPLNEPITVGEHVAGTLAGSRAGVRNLTAP